MSSDPDYVRISMKRTVSGARRVAEEYADVRLFVHSQSVLLSFADVQR